MSNNKDSIDDQLNDKNQDQQIKNDETEKLNDNDETHNESHGKNDHQPQQQIIQRSESVIKSPSKSTPTPVIQVINTTDGGGSADNNNKDDQMKKISSPPVTICSPSSNGGGSSGGNFLLSTNIAPNNPFLRATSFHTNNSSLSSSTSSTSNSIDGDQSDSSSGESQIIFAPPKLIPSSSIGGGGGTSFLKPSILKTCDSSLSDIRKPAETISTSKTFISLNKEDIGKIKTPSFIKLTTSPSTSLSSLSPLIGTSNGSNTNNLIKTSLSNSINSDETSSSSSSSSSVIKSPNKLIINNDPSETFLFGQKVEDRVVIDHHQSETTTNILSTSSCTSSSSSFNTLSTVAASSSASTSTSSSQSSDHRLISFSDVTNCEELTQNESKNADSLTSTSSSFTSSSSTIIMKNGENNNNNNNNADIIFKRKYEVITGEEDEQNVLSIHGRLYAWDTDKASWVEKGRGPLHLNDVMKNDRLCSRLVMRTAGAYRLILNALIVSGMTFELANDNCLRFTYIDGIYMIKANPKDIDQLHSAIENRLREISKRIRSTTTNTTD